MAKKDSSAPQVFIEQTRAYQILQGFLMGKSVYDMADELGTPEENIRRTISQERLKLTAAMQEMQEQHMAITYARTEWLISKVFPVIEKQIVENGAPDKNLLEVALKIMKFQNETVIPKNADKLSSPDVVINQTFVGGSDMYKEAMEEMRSDFYDEIRIEKEGPRVITASPEMSRLEELASTYLPEGVRDEKEDD